MKRNPYRFKEHKRFMYEDLVRQRMNILYSLAVEAVKNGDLDYASKLGELIRKLHERTRVKIPVHIKRWLCKKCNTPLIPGVTATVRLRAQGAFSYVVVRCNVCGWIHRYPYKKGR